MKFDPVEPPREFEVGYGERIFLKDCAQVRLEENEQVTFHSPDGAEYDVVRKSWGFYATPSMNGRLLRFGLRTVLVKNRIEQYFLLLVERGHEDEFQKYLDVEALHIVAWLDSTEELARLEAAAKDAGNG